MPLTDSNKTPVTANDQVVGFDEQLVVPYCNAEIQISDETDFETITSNNSQTVKVEFKNGWKYVLSDAFVQGTPTMNEAGVAQISFAGKRGQWFK